MKKDLKNKRNVEIVQEMQDEIFRKMSADKKIKAGSGMWRLAKSLTNKDVLWKKKIQGKHYKIFKKFQQNKRAARVINPNSFEL